MQKNCPTELLTTTAGLVTKSVDSTGERLVSAPKKAVEAPGAPSVSKSNHVAVLFSLLSLYIIWGSTYLAMRIGLQGFSPFLLAGIRFLVAGVALYVFLRARGAPRPGRVQWLGAALIGLLLLAGGNGGVVFAEQWVATGLASVSLAAIPLWTALFAGLWGRWPSRIEWWGLGLGFIGVLLLNTGSSIWANPIGAIALIIAPISWALGTAWSRHIPLPSGLMSSAVQMLVGGAFLLLLGAALREPMPKFADMPAVGAEVYLIVFGSLLAFCAYGYLVRHVRPALATSYAYVNPMVAVGLGVAFNGENITPLGVFAMLVILTGVGLVTMDKARS